ncbi:hypothetical protein MMC07_005687 [Pseudocyphellaria aurata]|nr:hypothetical protein [Pseudocyphellaria aurata]
MRNKRNINLAQLRREVAELLKNNKQEHARIRVEAVLREANLLKAYDILELFTEMLAVRVQMIEKSKDTPPDMLEALSSIVYASQRVQLHHLVPLHEVLVCNGCLAPSPARGGDFPEMLAIRALLAHKYGKEFVAEAADDSICRKWQVNENLRNCLAVEAPSPELKLQTLSDIAQEHNVEWDAHSAAMDMLPYNHPTTAPGYFNSERSLSGLQASR